MEYRIIRDGELYHHGIKGQKWGRRLYQNADGSLTPLGKIRYNHNSDFKKSVDRANALKKARAAKEAKKTEAEKKAEIMKSSDPEYILKNKNLLTTDEMNACINRINTEARLKAMIPEKETGLKALHNKMQNISTTADKASNMVSSVDKAFKTLTGTGLGQSVCKALGIETKKKKAFDLDDFTKNIDKKSNQEIADVANRLKNMNNIYNYQKKQQADNSQNNNNASNNKTAAYSNVNGRANKDDIPHVKNATMNSNKKKNTETYTGTVEGTGTSRYQNTSTNWDDNPTWYDTTPSSSNYNNRANVGHDYLQLLLEDKNR